MCGVWGLSCVPAWARNALLQIRGEIPLTWRAKSMETGASLSLQPWRALNPLSSTGSLALWVQSASE